MKRLDREEILSAADRKDLQSAARAAEVLHAATQYLHTKLGNELYFLPRVWKNGTLRVAVESPAVAQKVYAEAEGLLELLRERFPEYRFREVRTEIGVREE